MGIAIIVGRSLRITAHNQVAEFSDWPEYRSNVPITPPQELTEQGLAPLVGDVLRLAKLRPLGTVNMMADLVIEHHSDHRIASYR